MFCKISLEAGASHRYRSSPPSLLSLSSPSRFGWNRENLGWDGRWLILFEKEKGKGLSKQSAKSLVQSGMCPGHSAQTASLLALLHPFFPGFIPSIIAHRIAQEQHGIHVLSFPMHPGPLETSLNDQLVRTLDHARTNGPASRSKGWVLHARLACVQILEFFPHFGIGTVGAKSFQMPQHALGSLVFEPMQ